MNSFGKSPVLRSSRRIASPDARWRKGPIVKLAVKDNQFIKAGDLLFQIDPRTFEASVDQKNAEYDITKNDYLAQIKRIEEAKAQVEVSRTLVLQAESTIKELESEIVKYEAEFKRQEQLLPQKATSQRSLDKAKADHEVSVEKRKGALAAMIQEKAALVQSQASLEEAKAKLGEPGDSNANIRQAKAALRQAELDLEFTEVRASVDGYITNLNLRLGSHAVANQPALALVDVNSYWIYGFFKETYLSKISKGDKAIVTLMAYRGKPIEGNVESLGWGISQQDGSTGENLLVNVSPTFEWIRLAQRIPVLIRLNELPEGAVLRMGMTASVLVKTGSCNLKEKQ